jgi:hypothetical protein
VCMRVSVLCVRARMSMVFQLCVIVRSAVGAIGLWAITDDNS